MLKNALNIDDVRRLARRRLPRAIFDYIDRGAEDEVEPALGFLGCASPQDLDASFVNAGP